MDHDLSAKSEAIKLLKEKHSMNLKLDKVYLNRTQSH